MKYEVNDSVTILNRNNGQEYQGTIVAIRPSVNRNLYDVVLEDGSKHIATYGDIVHKPIIRDQFIPDFINHMEPEQIFVAGTNDRGNHGAGAARYAEEHFGLKDGFSEGLCGQTYAFPSMGGLTGYVGIEGAAFRFLNFADCRRDLTFLMTRVGAGIAGHYDKEVTPFFKDAPSNVLLPIEWKQYVS